MPNIPNVPGVPPLTSFLSNPLVLLVEDLVAPIVGTLAPPWGIFLDGESVISADSVVDFEFKQDFPISDYAVEQGSFQSYNKVQLPAQIRMRLATGGSEGDRAAFLASIDAVMTTTDLYDVVTPEQVYTSYNFTHRDLTRTARNGVGLIVVDLWLTEVRESATATFQDTQQPQDAGQQGGGNVQPQTPSSFVSQEFGDGGWQ